jgi:hypothetical protein
MSTMGRMLREVVYQRLAMSVDDDALRVIRLELGCFDADESTPDGKKSIELMRRLFRDAWRRLGHELCERLARPRRSLLFGDGDAGESGRGARPEG